MSTATASKRAARPNDAGIPLTRWLLDPLGSTVGSKFLVALTGLIVVVWLGGPGASFDATKVIGLLLMLAAVFCQGVIGLLMELL